MDYEKRYKELVAKIKNAHLYAQTDSTKNVLENILHELAESEDEKIRKDIIDYCNKRMNNQFETITINRVKLWLPWLEKQGEQKLLNIQIPHWKKSTLPDLVWGMNSDYLTCPDGYYIELKELLKLPKDE